MLDTLTIKAIEQTIDSIEQLQSREGLVEELVTLLRASGIICSVLEITQLPQVVEVQTRKMMKVEKSLLVLVDPEHAYPDLVHERIVPNLDHSRWLGTPIAKAMQTGEPVLIQQEANCPRSTMIDLVYPCGDNRCYSLLCMPIQRRGKIWGALEILNKCRGQPFTKADLALLKLLTEEVAIAVENAILYETARREMLGRITLYEVIKTISSSLELEEVLNQIIDSLRQVVPYDAAAIFLLNPQRHVIETQTTRGYPEELIARLGLKVGEGISGWAAKTGSSTIVPDVDCDSRYVNLHPSTRSELAVPLLLNDQVIGVFNLESDRLNAYTRKDLELLEAFAGQAAIAIHNARLHQTALRKQQLEQDMLVAGQIQRALLPRHLPDIPGFSLAALNVQSEPIGGDFYHLITLRENRIGICISDVCGKGTPGAIMMASLHASFTSLVSGDHTPAEVALALNQFLYETTAPDRFATFFYGILDPRQGHLHYTNAGHTPPLLVRRNGRLEYLERGGMVLGAFEAVSYCAGEIHLEVGDVLVLYTDGVTEAMNENEEEFGSARLEQVVRQNLPADAKTLQTRIVDAIGLFTGATLQSDDITLVILKRESSDR